jgi:hypothetical protein
MENLPLGVPMRYKVPTRVVAGRDLDRPELRTRDDMERYIARCAGVSVAEVRQARSRGEKRATPTGNKHLDDLRETIERNLDAAPRKAAAVPATRPAVSAETARARRFVGDLG